LLREIPPTEPDCGPLVQFNLLITVLQITIEKKMRKLIVRASKAQCAKRLRPDFRAKEAIPYDARLGSSPLR
jgi:hypothetical protein